MNRRQVLPAYLIAPLGAAIPFLIADVVSSSSGGMLGGLTAAAVAYLVGALLLPLFWVFEEIGWQGWQFYVPTAAVAGVLTALVMNRPRLTSGATWTYYAISAGLGISCAVVFSIMLKLTADEPEQPTRDQDTRE